MYSEPWARFTKLMIPNTSVKPAASRNSRTPYCSPLSSWARRSVALMAFSLQRALAVIGVNVVLQGRGHLCDCQLAARLHRLEGVVVLHRQVVVVESERPAHRLELAAGDLHRGRQLAGITTGFAQCRVQQVGR